MHCLKAWDRLFGRILSIVADVRVDISSLGANLNQSYLYMEHTLRVDGSNDWNEQTTSWNIDESLWPDMFAIPSKRPTWRSNLTCLALKKELQFTFLNLRYLMTLDTSLGSQSSRLKILHFRQLHEFRLEELPELCPLVSPPAAKFRAELTLRLSADAGTRLQ